MRKVNVSDFLPLYESRLFQNAKLIPVGGRKTSLYRVNNMLVEIRGSRPEGDEYFFQTFTEEDTDFSIFHCLKEEVAFIIETKKLRELNLSRSSSGKYGLFTIVPDHPTFRQAYLYIKREEGEDSRAVNVEGLMCPLYDPISF